MTTATIRIDQAAHPTQVAGVAGRARNDIVLGSAVTLRSATNSGVTTWRWELLGKPTASSAALSNPTLSMVTFTPDVEGSYLVQLSVSDGLVGDTAKTVAAVLDSNGLRIPAPGESTEANWLRDGIPNTDGWYPDVEAQLLHVRNASTVVSVTDARFGATGDGSTDDTASIQAAIDATFDSGGGVVYLPPGIYIVSGVPCLRMRTGVNIIGAGVGVTTLRLDAEQPNFARILNCATADAVADITIRDLTLDGDHPSTALPGENSSTIFLHNVTNVQITNVESYRSHGDGVQIFDGCTGVRVSNCKIHDALRNGVTLDGVDTSDIRISGCSIYDIDVQPIDSEPTTAGGSVDVVIDGNRIESNGSHSITTGGTTNPNQRWKIVGNHIVGGIHIIHCVGIKIIGNSILGNAFRGPVYAQEGAEDALILGNTIVGDASDTYSAIAVLATGAGEPARFQIKDNLVEVNAPVSAAIQVQGTNDVEISGNRVTVNDTAPRHIIVRSTRDQANVEVVRNHLFSSVANPDGIFIWGDATYDLSRVRVHSNYISSDGGSQPTGGIEVVSGAFNLADIDIRENYISPAVSSPYQGLLLSGGHRLVTDNGALTVGIGDQVIELGSTDGAVKAATMNTNGVPSGQRVRVVMSEYSSLGSYTLAATQRETSGTVTLRAIDDGVDLLFDGSVWRVIGLLGSAFFS